MRRRSVLVVLLAVLLMAVLVPTASATIHPLVEAADCSQGDPQNAVGEVADPPGQTPGATPGQGNNALRAIRVLTDDFTDFSSPALLGHKLDGTCGRVGQ